MRYLLRLKKIIWLIKTRVTVIVSTKTLICWSNFNQARKAIFYILSSFITFIEKFNSLVTSD